MNKKVYNTILLFTGFVLLGIIALQVVWLNNMSSIRKKELVTNTQQALTNTVFKLEKQENVGMVYAHMGDLLPDSIPMGPFGQVKVVVNTHDSIQTVDFSNSHTFGSWGSNEKHFRNHEVITTRIQQENNRRMSDTLSRISKKTKDMDNIVQQMVIEMTRMSTSERIHTDRVQNQLTEELHNRGIDVHYEYAIIQNDSIIHKSDQYAPSSDVMFFDTKLFPNDIFDKSLKLAMYYPISSSNNYLFSKMKTTLLLTGLFTLGILIAFYLTIRTIKKQKKLGDMKNDFINNITHEFKTPIATSAIAIAALENQQVRNDNERFNYYTGVLKEENQKMNQHVEKVLQLAMMDKGKLEVVLQNMNGNEVLQNSLKGFELLFKENKINVQLQLNASQANIKSDPFHLIHVFNNIIDNAIKYKSESAQLAITTENKDGKWIARFADNGPGMSNEVLKNAFETFYRGQKGNIHDVKGFGLGLSYAKNIIESCKGTIHINSTVNKGTEVIITLPLA